MICDARTTGASLSRGAIARGGRTVEALQIHLDTMGVGVVLKPFDIDHRLREVVQKLNA